MAFSAKQVKALRRSPDHRYIRTREANGRELTYLEGWYAISEANRIFGFDGWSRETIESKCVLARENKGTFLAVYLARVRLTIEADGSTIIREGHGTGEGRGVSPGEVHDVALKAAETDATKRALATFGRPFGLELYKGASPGKHRQTGRAVQPAGAGHDLGTQGLPAPGQEPLLAPAAAPPLSPVSVTMAPVGADPHVGFHPDDTTPIPRPSRYYGRRQKLIGEHFRNERRQAERAMGPRLDLPTSAAITSSGSGSSASSASSTTSASTTAPPLAPAIAAPPLAPAADLPLLPSRIDKSQLTLSEPRRLRDKNHLKFVATKPCLVCGREPCDPHHLRFAQPRAIGLKVSDEFTVPLCRGHHRELHQAGNELVWWDKRNIKPLEIARALWEETPKATTTDGIGKLDVPANMTSGDS